MGREMLAVTDPRNLGYSPVPPASKVFIASRTSRPKALTSAGSVLRFSPRIRRLAPVLGVPGLMGPTHPSTVMVASALGPPSGPRPRTFPMDTQSHPLAG